MAFEWTHNQFNSIHANYYTLTKLTVPGGFKDKMKSPISMCIVKIFLKGDRRSKTWNSVWTGKFDIANSWHFLSTDGMRYHQFSHMAMHLPISSYECNFIKLISKFFFLHPIRTWTVNGPNTDWICIVSASVVNPQRCTNMMIDWNFELLSLFTIDHFSDPSRAIDPACVCPDNKFLKSINNLRLKAKFNYAS